MLKYLVFGAKNERERRVYRSIRPPTLVYERNSYRVNTLLL